MKSSFRSILPVLILGAIFVFGPPVVSGQAPGMLPTAPAWLDEVPCTKNNQPSVGQAFDGGSAVLCLEYDAKQLRADQIRNAVKCLSRLPAIRQKCWASEILRWFEKQHAAWIGVSIARSGNTSPVPAKLFLPYIQVPDQYHHQRSQERRLPHQGQPATREGNPIPRV